MKKLIVTSLLSMFAMACLAGEPFSANTTANQGVVTEDDKPNTKKACVKKTGKDGKMRQECRIIKVHKKLEGTPVPSKK